MGVYLEDNPPKRSQFRKKRRAEVTGAIVIHTAENKPDINGPDRGAENVAKFIAGRSESGSYHSVVDSSSVLHLVRYEWEAFHEGTGGNRWSLGLTFATKASEWQRLPPKWVDDIISNGAKEARAMADWVKSTVDVDVPARRISASEYRAGEAGFVTHAELDPGRRSDPGSQFPWQDFLDQFEELGNIADRDAEDVDEKVDDVEESDETDEQLSEAVTVVSATAGIQNGQRTAALEYPFSLALDDIDELYRAYKGTRPSSKVRQEIAKDLARHVFADGNDSYGFVVDVEKRLRTEE